MKIAFHSPLKSPNHPVPSGDRLMARLLIAALGRAGHVVDVASELRTFLAGPEDDGRAAIDAAAVAEIERIDRLWRMGGAPDVWFCYHPYYKAPDLVGPELARRFAIAYVTAEASYSQRRNRGLWSENQRLLAETVRHAAVNLCFTRRDRDGLGQSIPGGRFRLLRPFIDPSAYLAVEPVPQAGRIVTVAMMRPGDKFESYRMLAAALARLPEGLPWTLSIIGDGALRSAVEALFSPLPGERILWHGQCGPAEISDILSRAAVYAWPGTGEAYGLAYLEAQAAGLPVVAQRIAGVPEVVCDGVTGMLTPAGDVEAYAAALVHILTDGDERRRMALAARRFVTDECSIEGAALRLDEILSEDVGGRR